MKVRIVMMAYVHVIKSIVIRIFVVAIHKLVKELSKAVLVQKVVMIKINALALEKVELAMLSYVKAVTLKSAILL